VLEWFPNILNGLTPRAPDRLRQQVTQTVETVEKA
jgi:hypothetical protein